MKGRALVGTAIVAVSIAWVASASAPGNPADDATQPHHTPDGFRNNYAGAVTKSLADLVRWRWQALRDSLPPPPAQPVASAKPEIDRLLANNKWGALPATGGAPVRVPSVTWIGHATTLVQSGGLNILTDPVFSERSSPVQFAGPRRAQAAGIALDALPRIDVVLISHNHYDHLDRASVVSLSQRADGKTLFLVPLGLKSWMEQQGVRNVVELDWWDIRTHEGVEFRLVPVQHWSARGLADRNESLWGGWAVFAGDLHWYFSGDSGYTRDFADTRQRLAAAGGNPVFDLAILAIGAYEPRWFMRAQHMNPAESVQAHKDLGARRSLGVHWGTFNLTDEALDQPPRDLEQARRAQGLGEDEFFLLRIGETRWLEPRN